MKLARFSTIFAAVSGSVIWFGASADAVMKCGAQLDRDRQLMALDGVISTRKSGDPLPNVNPAEVYSVHVLCMNPKDSTFNRSHGVPIVSVWTITAVTQLKTALTEIIAAQDAHYQRTRTYSSDVASMNLPATSRKLEISVEVRERGWIARGTMPRFMATCIVFDGEVGDIADDVPRRVSCN